jgi:hypothetical protein
MLAVRNHAPGETASFRLRRNGRERDVKLELSAFPTTPLKPIVRAAAKGAPAPAGLPDVVAPEDYSDASPHGLIVWLIDPARGEWKERAAAWKKALKARRLILLGVSPRPKKAWEPIDLARARSMVREVQKKYAVDPLRVAVLGEPTSAAAAEQLAMEKEGLFHGAVLLGGAPTVRDADPQSSLLFFFVRPRNDGQKPTGKELAERLTKAGHPSTFFAVDPDAPILTEEKLVDQIGRWTELLGAF